MNRFQMHMSLVSCAAILLAGCFGTDEDDGDDKDKVVYVAMGNSLTAGFQSGGLKAEWQKASYPAKLAEAMGITDFQLPTIEEPGIGRQKINGKTATPLIYDPATGSIAPKLLEVETSSLLSNRALAVPYGNLGVPGATASDLMHAYDSNTSQSPGNGYFNIVIRGGLFQNASMLRQAIIKKPTIMTLWIGNNEILGGITAGTVSVTPPLVTVLPVQIYSVQMDSILDTLMRETSARIFMANVPSITTIPFVTTVKRWITKADFTPAVDTNTLWLTKEADVQYVLLPALAEVQTGKGLPKALGGTGDSLSATVTLTKGEVAIANGLIDAYNAYLKKKAEDNASRITLVDINTLLKDLNDGKITGLSSQFILLNPTQTAFSLDGIHPNAKGYKEVTNLFIKTVNSTLGKSYPEMN